MAAVSTQAAGPGQDTRDALVMHLAVDWTIATGTEPLPGRSDHAGFGDFVHSVFQWLPANLPQTRRSDGIGMKSRRAGPDPRPSSSL